MKSQQEMIRVACMSVLGKVPAKGQESKEVFTVEVREKIAEVMMPLLGIEWEIKSEKARERAKDYIVGVQSTDLLQNWTFLKRDPKEKKSEGSSAVSKPKLSVDEIIQMKEAGFSIEDIKALLG